MSTDWHILLGMFGMLWIFSGSIGKKFDKLEAKIDKLEDKIERVEQRVNDIDRRLVVIETLLHMKECCVLKDDNKLKKAE